MANTVIQLRNSTVTGNVPSSLANGEISINSRDGKFFYSTPAGSVVTHYPYLGPAGLNKEVQFNDSGILGSSSGLTFDKASGYLTATLIRANQSSGDEGGQIDLATSVTNTTLAGGYVNIDIYQNKLRIFESGGANRGVFIDLANGASSSVGTNLLSSSTSTDSWGRNQANAAFLQANTPSHVANSAASYANSSFVTANSAGVYANSAFLAANTPSHVANSAASYANSAFTRANNSINANTGGTITGNLTISGNLTMTGAGNISVANISITNNLSAVTAALTVNSITTGTGTGGTITGANTIYSNVFVANSSGYIQFSDGSKQYTANAGSGGGGGTTDWGFGIIYTANNNTYANAAAANSQVNFVGESGVVVYANSITKTIAIAGTPGAQGMTVDYGYVADPLYYAIDYGTL
jgi:hypothetical protein